MSRLLAVVIVACLTNPVLSQITAKPGKFKAEYFGSYSIPNPDDKLSLASLLQIDAVRKEVGLDEQQSSLFRESLQKFGGSFSVSIVAVPPGQAVSEEKAKEVYFKKRQEAQALLDEILRPDQWARLKQLAYQVEVHRVGMATAITEGKLAADTAVNENQKAHLRERAQELDKAAAIAISKILEDVQAKILEELTAEQRGKAKDLLGKPFLYRENPPRSQK